MQIRVLITTVGVLVLVAGCMPKPAPVAELDPVPVALMEVRQACEEKPPKMVEVPVPVPMPCQLKPGPQFVSTQAGTPRPKVRGAKAVALANTEAREGADSAAQWMNSVKQFPYMPGALYQVYTAIGKVTTLQFQPGERIQTYAVGDKEGLDVQQASPGGDGKTAMLFLMPRVADTKTNLTVQTSKRVYLVEVTVTPETYMAQVTWQYAPEVGGAVVQNPEPPAEEPVALAAGVPVEALHFNYAISSKQAPRWQPLRVFDDGARVYIQFPSDLSTGEAPVLFLRSPEGTTQLVNYRVRGTLYIVDRLFDVGELRVGEKHPLVVKITRQQAQ